jgi:predicted DNA-binding transcriptional regulator YafY
MPETLIQRLKTIDTLIQKKNTGKATCLALKIGVSERTVKEYIAKMKEFGAPIYFNRKISSYCYTHKVEFIMQFERI